MVKVNIVAPMDVKKDTPLELELDGKIRFVKCPRDVAMGETVEVDVVTEETAPTPAPTPVPTPIPTSIPTPIPASIPTPIQSVTLDKKSNVTLPVHEGSFKYGLCGCTEVCCQPMWWATFCVQGIPFAQLLNRFRWSPCASPTKMSRSTVFTIVVGMYLVLYICNSLYSSGRKCEAEVIGNYVYEVCSLSTLGVILYIIAAIIGIIFIVMLVRARMAFRKHYKINGNCCADFCTMWFCSCCSVIQMLRQTHNEKEHKYSCCSCMTGLKDTAPEIV